MALSPEIEINEVFQSETIPLETSRTYRIDLDEMRITNEIIDGIEAIKQFIYVSLRVPRYAYAIYSNDVGNEIEELLSDNTVTVEFKKMELPRLIKEALVYDDRIDDVINFEIEHIDDSFHVRFTVLTAEGYLNMEEVF